MWVAFALCKSYSHFFSKKFQHICVSVDVNFNESLTNDIVSFEQLDPGKVISRSTHFPVPWNRKDETMTRTNRTVTMTDKQTKKNYNRLHWILTKNEPAHDKTYNKRCVTRKDSDQPVYPSSMAMVLVHPSLDSPEAVKCTCDQRRLWSDCADAQSDLSLHWSLKSYCRFCCALAKIYRKQLCFYCRQEKNNVSKFILDHQRSKPTCYFESMK